MVLLEVSWEKHDRRTVTLKRIRLRAGARTTPDRIHFMGPGQGDNGR
jgi:hypothetical protein